MDGILLLTGYKLKQQIYLNLQKYTLLVTHSDYYTPVVIFDLLESYFTKNNFSDKYLNTGIQISLNNDKLISSDYIVYRLKPMIDLEAEIKIVKKTILGQFLEQKYRDKNTLFENINNVINIEVVDEINTILENYDLKVCCSEQNIFNFAKLLTLNSYFDNEEILFREHSQYQAKKFLIDLICKLETDKPKLLLLELPEYGLDSNEVRQLFSYITQINNIESVIIYTNSKECIEHIKDIYAYHVIKRGSVLGFDDYDEMETLLEDKTCGTKSKEQLIENLLEILFAETEYNKIFGAIDAMFRKYG